jgi:four helix bundle protein
MNHRSEVMQDRLIDFSVLVCRLVGQLPSDFFSAHVSRQVLRCCTSPPPNYAEAQSAESRQDFIHKMRVCLKELRETYVWLKMMEKFGVLPAAEFEGAGKECDELIAIFTKSVLTATRRGKEGT